MFSKQKHLIFLIAVLYIGYRGPQYIYDGSFQHRDWLQVLKHNDLLEPSLDGCPRTKPFNGHV